MSLSYVFLFFIIVLHSLLLLIFLTRIKLRYFKTIMETYYYYRHHYIYSFLLQCSECGIRGPREGPNILDLQTLVIGLEGPYHDHRRDAHRFGGPLWQEVRHDHENGRCGLRRTRDSFIVYVYQFVSFYIVYSLCQSGRVRSTLVLFYFCLPWKSDQGGAWYCVHILSFQSCVNIYYIL